MQGMIRPTLRSNSGFLYVTLRWLNLPFNPRLMCVPNRGEWSEWIADQLWSITPLSCVYYCYYYHCTVTTTFHKLYYTQLDELLYLMLWTWIQTITEYFFVFQRGPCTALSVLFILYSAWHQVPADLIIWGQKTGLFFFLLFLLASYRHLAFVKHQLDLRILSCNWSCILKTPDFSHLIGWSLFSGHFISLFTSIWCSWRREDAHGQLWSTANSFWGTKIKAQSLGKTDCRETDNFKFSILNFHQNHRFKPQLESLQCTVFFLLLTYQLSSNYFWLAFFSYRSKVAV